MTADEQMLELELAIWQMMKDYDLETTFRMHDITYTEKWESVLPPQTNICTFDLITRQTQTTIRLRAVGVYDDINEINDYSGLDFPIMGEYLVWDESQGNGEPMVQMLPLSYQNIMKTNTRLHLFDLVERLDITLPKVVQYMLNGQHEFVVTDHEARIVIEIINAEHEGVVYTECDRGYNCDIQYPSRPSDPLIPSVYCFYDPERMHHHSPF